jgi:excisionase family DNA binding protein
MDADTSSTSAFTITQVIQRTKLGRDSIYRAIRDDKLIARKYGKRTLVVAADLEKFLTSLPTIGAKRA